MLELYSVYSGYGRLPVLFDINFSIAPGELVAVVGPNGAGKSTLLKTILGVVSATRGTIVFDQTRVTHEPPSGRFLRGIALSPEGRRIFMNLTVKENLVTGSSGVAPDVVTRQMERIFELFPVLGQRQGQRAGSLSGGEQQMLAIGRALMSRPRLLMLDEPSMGLSPIMMQLIFSTIRDLKERGTTILLVEQNAQAALSLADKGYVIETGRIVLSDSGPSLLEDESVRKAYLGED